MYGLSKNSDEKVSSHNVTNLRGIRRGRVVTDLYKNNLKQTQEQREKQGQAFPSRELRSLVTQCKPFLFSSEAGSVRFRIPKVMGRVSITLGDGVRLQKAAYN